MRRAMYRRYARIGECRKGGVSLADFPVAIVPLDVAPALPGIMEPGEQPVKDGYNDIVAGQKHRQWSLELRDWLDKRDLRDWERWDRLTPKVRKELEAIQHAGYDRITREKMGLAVEDD